MVKRERTLVSKDASPEPSRQPGPQRAGAVVVVVIPAATEVDRLIRVRDRRVNIAAGTCDHPLMVRASQRTGKEDAFERRVRQAQA